MDPLLAAGLLVWALGTALLLLAMWKTRPAARWPQVRREVFADLVRRYSEPDAPGSPRDLERTVTVVAASAEARHPRRHAHLRVP